jgi:hypothetical protein
MIVGAAPGHHHVRLVRPLHCLFLGLGPTPVVKIGMYPRGALITNWSEKFRVFILGFLLNRHFQQ